MQKCIDYWVFFTVAFLLVLCLTEVLMYYLFSLVFLLFDDVAFAAGTSADKAAGSAGVGATIAGFLPLVLIFLVFYFLIIRPQQKKAREHSDMIDSVKRGDKIVTSGGIVGEIIKVDKPNAIFTIEISKGVEIKVKKTAIAEMYEPESCKDGGGRGTSSTVSDKSDVPDSAAQVTLAESQTSASASDEKS